MPPQTSRRRQNTTRFARDSESRRPTRNGTNTRRVQRDQGRRGGRGNPYDSPRTSRMGRRGSAKQRPVAGFISLGCFGVYLLCMAVLISTAMNVMSGAEPPTNLGNFIVIALIAGFAPFAGIAAGIIGLLNKRVSKVPAIIGLCLNALPALVVLKRFIE